MEHGVASTYSCSCFSLLSIIEDARCILEKLLFSFFACLQECLGNREVWAAAQT